MVTQIISNALILFHIIPVAPSFQEVVDPLDDLDTQVQPASIDLRLGEEFLTFQRTNIPCIHPNRQEDIDQYVTEKEIAEGDDLILHPGDFVLGTTASRIQEDN